MRSTPAGAAPDRRLAPLAIEEGWRAVDLTQRPHLRPQPKKPRSAPPQARLMKRPSCEQGDAIYARRRWQRSLRPTKRTMDVDRRRTTDEDDKGAGPFTKVWVAHRTQENALSFRWLNVAAMSAHSMCRLPIRPRYRKIVKENIARESRLHTDESKLYFGTDQHFATHETVHHTSKEYVRGDVHTNSAKEGYFSIFKRGMRGVYQHCKEKHLHRYLAEFDFRYNFRVASAIRH